MKAVVLILLFASCAWGFTLHDELANEWTEALDRRGVTPKMLESNIVGMLENAIASIPRFTEHQDVNITFGNDTITAKGTVDAVNITGLDDHTIDGVKFSILPIYITLHIYFKDVQVRGLYDIDGLFGQVIPLYGNGDLDVGVTDFSFSLRIDLTSKSLHLVVQDLNIAASVGTVRFRLGNFLDGDLGQVVSEVIEENASDYLARFIYYYGQEFEDIISEKANEFLVDKTLDDLIDIIQGKTTVPASSTEPSF